MIEIKVWPDGPCDECRRGSSESIKTSIKELHDGVYQQGIREGFNMGLSEYRRSAEQLIEEKKRTINKGDLTRIECELIKK